MNHHEIIQSSLTETRNALALIQTQNILSYALLDAARVCIEALRRGNKILLCGNGGSASDAQHIAAELVVRFCRNRAALPAVALTCDGAILTAISNDFDFVHVFSRQVEALGNPGDVLLAFTTSGQSPNVLAAIETAQARGLATIAFVGQSQTSLIDRTTVTVRVPSKKTSCVQECHIVIAHILCDIIEREMTQV